MLIQFSYNNFSSFKDDTIFSMIFGKNNDKKNTFPFEKYEILPSSVIYVANASGKTNFIKAFSMMRDIALNKNKTMLSTDELPFNPFRLSTETEDASTAFDVIFEYEEKKYKYGFDYDKNRIYSEYLQVYETNQPTTIFEYDNEENNEKANINPKFHELKGLTHNDNLLLLWAADQRKNKYAQNVLKWFKSCRCNMETFPCISISNKFFEPRFENLLTDIMKCADFGIEKIYKENTRLSELKTIHKKYDSNKQYVSDAIFDLKNDESTGTNKFLALTFFIADALWQGNVIFFDELDASLHPTLTRELIEVFNSPSTNFKNAQLIFTCQDTNLLNSELFHKSQIWFAEKDEYGASHLTSLTEFKDVNSTDNFEKNYIRGKYGAIPYLGDFDKAFLEKK